MELCTGNSLYEVIDSPDNAFGLCETEFKQVIYDVGRQTVHRMIQYDYRVQSGGGVERGGKLCAVCYWR